MNRITLAAAAAACTLLAAFPALAASAANSQNGTDSSNANATLSAPKSDAQIPAAAMPLGTTGQPAAADTGTAMPKAGMAPAAGTSADAPK